MTVKRKRASSKSPNWPPVRAYSFQAGPYPPPRLAVGTVVRDLRWGDVEVAGVINRRSPGRVFSAVATTVATPG